MGRRIATLILPALLCAGLVAPGIADAARPNIVLVLTDDQRWDTVAGMATVEQELGGNGVTFTNAFAVNPLCCPSRATILTGRYSHSTMVYSNADQYGGVGWFDDDSTIATWLRDSGYRTGYMGKYLNGYGGNVLPPSPTRWFLPPGWDRWFGYAGGYYDYNVNSDGFIIPFGTEEADYSTDVLAREAISFMDSSSGQPFFLVYAPYAPHVPADPPARYDEAFTDLPPWRPASFGETNVSDKPRWVRRLHPLTRKQRARIEELRRNQLASQFAIDDGVKAILGSLEASGRLGTTMIVFASDNGLLWGEHRLFNQKIAAYEESIRVPLIIRYDPLVKTPRSNKELVANVDLAPTFAAVAGIPAPGAQGRSLLPLLTATPGDPPRWRKRLVIEHRKGGPLTNDEVPTYCAVRSNRFKYVVYSTHEEELYDLLVDPAELENRAGDPTLRATKFGLRADVRRLCNPPPPGFGLAWLCTVEPAPGATSATGTAAAETICGRKAGEVLRGQAGNDVVLGSGGDDRLYGGAGPDRIIGGTGSDRLDGGPSDDTLLARDDRRDRIVCGAGLDLVVADKRDLVTRDCEQVRRG